MARYILQNGGLFDRETGERMVLDGGWKPVAPIIMSDIPEYRSPVTGLPITSRSHRREDLKRNDCVEAPPRKKRDYRNEKYARANHQQDHR